MAEKHHIIIHEKQARQLCAIHAVNNLLQLPPGLKLGQGSNIDDEGSDCDFDGVPNDNNEIGPLDKANDGAIDYPEESNAHLKKKCKIQTWSCHGKTLCQLHNPLCNEAASSKQWYRATQTEFDSIAKDCTLRERMLMMGDTSTIVSSDPDNQSTPPEIGDAGTTSAAASTANKLSWMNRWTSQHGTPYLGNYSLEVIEIAFQRRGVELKFFRVPDPPNVDDNAEDVGKVPDAAINMDDVDDFTIGFLIHDENRRQNSTVSFLYQIGNRIPFVKNVCGGQHWYAITRVRYTCKNIDRTKDDTVGGEKTGNTSVDPQNCTASKNNVGVAEREGNEDRSEEKGGDFLPWYLVDSNLTDVVAIDSVEPLFDYLKQVEQGGGLVFRAVFSSKESSGRLEKTQG